MHCYLRRLNLGKHLKWAAVIKLTTNKSISHKYSGIMSKRPSDMSEVMELHKKTFADILNMLGQGKIRIEPHT